MADIQTLAERTAARQAARAAAKKTAKQSGGGRAAEAGTDFNFGANVSRGGGGKPAGGGSGRG